MAVQPCMKESFTNRPKYQNFVAHARIQSGDRGSGLPPWKITKTKGFLAILVRIRWKSKSYQASIQCWVIIGPLPSAKRHLNGVSLARFKCYWDSLSPHKKRCQRLTKLSGSALCVAYIDDAHEGPRIVHEDWQPIDFLIQSQLLLFLHVAWEFYMAKWCHIRKGR